MPIPSGSATPSAEEAPLASPADLAPYLQSPTDDERAAAAVRRATNRLVATLGWDPRQSARTVEVYADRSTLLPAMNITAVSCAPAYGTAPASIQRWTTSGLVRWSHYFTGTVTFTAGWAPVPEVLVDVVLEWAASWLTNPQNVRSFNWQVGAQSEQTTYATVGEDSLGDYRLEAYRLPGQSA